MKSCSKRAIFGAGLVVHMSYLAMSSEYIESEKSKVVCCSEGTKLHQMVTAEWLDDEQLLFKKRLFWSVNAKDCYGCTPIYHLVMHADATIDLVKRFIDQGAQFDITNNVGNSPYDHVFKYYDAREDVCYYEIADMRKIINLVHCATLEQKLSALKKMLTLSKNHPFLKKRSKSSTFYVIR